MDKSDWSPFFVFSGLFFSVWNFLPGGIIVIMHQGSAVTTLRVTMQSNCVTPPEVCVTDKLRVVSSLRLSVIFITRVCKTCFLIKIVVSLYSCVPCIPSPVFRVPSLCSFIVLVYNCLHQFLKKNVFPRSSTIETKCNLLCPSFFTRVQLIRVQKH